MWKLLPVEVGSVRIWGSGSGRVGIGVGVGVRIGVGGFVRFRLGLGMGMGGEERRVERRLGGGCAGFEMGYVCEMTGLWG